MRVRTALGLLIAASSTSACEEESCRADEVSFVLAEPSSEVRLVARLETSARKGWAEVVGEFHGPEPVTEPGFEFVDFFARLRAENHHAALELPVRRLDTVEDNAVPVEGSASILGNAVGGCTVSLEVDPPQ